MIIREEHIGGQRLILGDCRDVLPMLGRFDAVVTDNPYGGRFNFDSTRFSGFSDNPELPPRGAGRQDREVSGDGGDFDPTPWLQFPEVILWGANHFAQKLPVGSTLIWLKKFPEHYGSFLSDAEVGWQKGGYGVYAFHAPDSNARRRLEATGSAFGSATAHPTQKPLALMMWCLGRIKGRVVLDPFMGSGTTLCACQKIGIEGTGIEIDPTYFDIACRRVEESARQPDMFREAAE